MNNTKPMPRPNINPVMGTYARLKVAQLHAKWGTYRVKPFLDRYRESKSQLGMFTVIQIIDEALQRRTPEGLIVSSGTPVATPEHLTLADR